MDDDIVMGGKVEVGGLCCDVVEILSLVVFSTG
jgi:hypothetical protein